MNAVDTTQSVRTRMRAARVDPDLPMGIVAPHHEGDVGWDLVAMASCVIRPMQVIDVPINAQLELPRGVWAEIRPRSSMARRNLQTEAGTIDNGYRGQIFVLVRYLVIPEFLSSSVDAMIIEKGERIGQLVLHRMAPAWLEEVPAIDKSTARGESGFGSTGIGITEKAA